MKAENLRSHTLWIYGVVVALAVREAVTRVVPHALSPPFEGFSALWPEALRLTVFLIIIVRFYLGAAEFFEKYAEGARDREAYVFDFFIGLLHFLIFFALAVTVSSHPTAATPQPSPQHWFLVTLCVILLYDWFWWVFTMLLGWKLPAPVPEWIAINTITFVFVLAGYFVSSVRLQPVTSETIAMVPVLFFSVLDLVDMSRDGTLIADFAKRVFARR